jgi:hypothetical protein
MKAILIDPASKTATETEYDGTLDSLYRLLGCAYVDYVRLNDDNGIFVDDDGLLNEHHRHIFVIETGDGRGLLFVSKGLVSGSDRDGTAIDTTMTAGQVAAIVTFLDRPRAASHT